MRLPCLLFAGLIGLGGTLATATVADASDAWRVPRAAKVMITGHGYGHGHGMSQYGAEGAARKGLSHRQIMRFYYPGTAWGRSGGTVTVLITADTSDDLVVRARPGLTVRGAGAHRRTTLPRNGASRWRLTPGSGGDTRVSYRTGRWHTWRTINGPGEFYARGNPMTLVTPSGERAYRGRLRAVRAPSQGWVTVNALSMQRYLKGVVPLEMPASWHPAAVRSQAVAARTYASYERNHPRSSAYQLCDTTSCQVYGGYSAEQGASNRAVDDTVGQVLTSGGQAAFTQFGSSSGGWTSAGSVRYLPAKRDPYDGWAGNPVHTWQVSKTDRALERAWPRLGNLTRVRVTRRDGHGEWGGRVESLVLQGSKGGVTVSGDSFRSALGLRSQWVTFRIRAR